MGFVMLTIYTDPHTTTAFSVSCNMSHSILIKLSWSREINFGNNLVRKDKSLKVFLQLN